MAFGGVLEARTLRARLYKAFTVLFPHVTPSAR